MKGLPWGDESENKAGLPKLGDGSFLFCGGENFIFRLITWNFQEGAVFKCKTEDMVRPKKPIYEELKGEVHKRKGDEEALSPEKQTIWDRSDKEELLLGLGLMLIEKKGLRSI